MRSRVYGQMFYTEIGQSSVLLENYWRLATLFVLCDAYYKWIERRSPDFPNDSLLNYDLEWRFYQCLLQSVVETADFVAAILGKN
uniref:Uncharacterized protein n=1 Tax=Plectus sambesii TaxID=2011161 RepID=A0A914X4N1_9BILA